MLYRKFNIDDALYKRLSSTERQVLKLLEEAVKGISKIYKRQLEEGFYPPGLTREKLERAAKNKPELLSPFTFVYQNNGRLEAIPYHQKYAQDLMPIVSKVSQAADISDNVLFKKYLRSRAKALVDGSYSDADIEWCSLTKPKIDFSIGPFERYLDKVRFLKRAYQAHVGIVDDKQTQFADQIKDILYSPADLSYVSKHSTEIPKKGVTILVEHTPATAGYMSDVLFGGEHFPCDLSLMLQCGSRTLIYLEQLKLKFEKLHYPVFKALFEKRFATKYTKDLLLRAAILFYTLNELSRQLHKYRGSRYRLKELYGVIDEANGFVSGIQHCKHLVVKGVISQDELEAIIITHITWIFSDWLVFQKNKGIESYTKGDVIALNQYLASGALKEHYGISWPNFSKIFFQIEYLANNLVDLLEFGSYNQAKRFIDKHIDTSNIERMAENIKNIEVVI